MSMAQHYNINKNYFSIEPPCSGQMANHLMHKAKSNADPWGTPIVTLLILDQCCQVVFVEGANHRLTGLRSSESLNRISVVLPSIINQIS